MELEPPLLAAVSATPKACLPAVLRRRGKRHAVVHRAQGARPGARPLRRMPQSTGLQYARLLAEISALTVRTGHGLALAVHGGARLFEPLVDLAVGALPVWEREEHLLRWPMLAPSPHRHASNAHTPRSVSTAHLLTLPPVALHARRWTCFGPPVSDL